MTNIGKYCPARGASNFAGSCALGYYCNTNSGFSRPNPALATLVDYFTTSYGGYCKPGQYCPSEFAVPIDCDPGFYCPDYLMTGVTLKCSEGFYCAGKAYVPTPIDNTTGNVCPAGKYCPEGSSTPSNCPVGTFLSYKGAKSRDECQKCTPGKYCDKEGLSEPAGNCWNGYVCQEGSESPTPNSICEMGYFCPNSTLTGAREQQQCAQGEFTESIGSSSCKVCSVGKYCSAADGFNKDCLAGNYCPGGNRLIQCPLGTYNTQTGKSLLSNCLPCESGYACDQTGLQALLQQCDAGYICTGGTITRKPNDVDGTSIYGSLKQGGKMCEPGKYCPSGSSTPAVCPAGQYCKDFAAGTTTGSCEGGYLCSVGEVVKNPIEKLCNPGYYCEPGAIVQKPCPKGRYSPSKGASSLDHCKPCPPGQVCDSESLIGNAYSTCPAGYYCPKEVSTLDPTEYKCFLGSECPSGSIWPKPCQPGTYQNQIGQAACLACPEGYYCDGSDRVTPQICLKGFYCPQGTAFANQYPCKPGTYNPFEGQQKEFNCLKIPAGYWNDGFAVIDYTKKPLMEGTFSMSTGQTTTSQTRCPMYHYCLEGTSTPIPCENGLTTQGTGAKNVEDCVPCERGQFCSFKTFFTLTPYTLIMNVLTAAAAYTGPCSSGYICLTGSSTKTPIDGFMGYQCPKGSYCTAGALVDYKCLPGTFMDIEGNSDPKCQTCIAGTMCPRFGMIIGDACEKGHYCPAGTIRSMPCPPGKFNSLTNAKSESECSSCTPGYFCGTWGLSAPTGTCQDGFICGGGSKVSTPSDATFSASTPLVPNGRCPKGHFCKRGDTTPTPCVEGTYNPAEGQSQCLSCPPGQYCSSKGLDTPTGLCLEGYMCEGGDKTPQGKAACDPKIGYCPQGAIDTTNCQDGYYLDSSRTCKRCKNGQKCIGGAVLNCDLFHYCNGDSIYGRLCPNGTYHDTSKPGILKTPNDCTTCKEKKFCVAGRITDDCNAGYICAAGADSPTPYNRPQAYACPKGFYCSAGVSEPQICPNGMFTFQQGALQVEECEYCQPGYYCEYGAIEAKVCPVGNYCPIGVQEPVKCPATRYNPKQMGKDVADCILCQKGFYCYDEGLANLTFHGMTYRCPEGHFCLPGTWETFECRAGSFHDMSTMYPPPGFVEECTICPEHYYCPKGADNRFAYPCPGGYFCSRGSTYPTLCSPGEYCKQKRVNGQNVIERAQCPENFYCPQGTSDPIPCKKQLGEICKKGSGYPTKTILTSTICKPGQYFGSGECNECEAGFVCVNNTNVKFPVYLSTEGGYECPPGHYCPRGSISPIKCPAGSYRRNKRGESLLGCLLCPLDAFNPLEGQTACIKCGRGALGNPLTNYQDCLCIGRFRQWRASDNQCICQSGYNEPDLPTVQGRTSTDVQDCFPDVKETCFEGTHYDPSFKACVSDKICQNFTLCNGKGQTEGFFNAASGKCLCRNSGQGIESQCDSKCQNNTLKAFLTSVGKVCLKAGTNKECYDKTIFADKIFLEGIICPDSQGECEITGVRNTDGVMQGSIEADQVFIDIWRKKYPSYKSAYQTSPATTNSTTKRLLQSSGPQLLDQAIICTRPYNPVTFQVSRTHYPIYLKDSLLNTIENFDDGLFDLLQVKLVNGNLPISTFMFSFKDEGVYVFADSGNYLISNTLVRVSKTLCPSSGLNIFPISEDNLKRFGITPQELELQTLPDTLIIIPVLFILLTIVSTIAQHLWEQKIERVESETRKKRAGRRGNFLNLDGKTNNRQYLADLYRLIKENMNEVKRMINEHDNKSNLLKLLKDRTSLLRELGDGGKDTVDDLKSQLKLLLEQLRFPDGSTLKDVLVHKQMEKEFHKKLNDMGENEDGENDHEEEARQQKFLDELDNLERRSSQDGGDDDDDDDDDDDEDVASDRSFLVDAIDKDLFDGGDNAHSGESLHAKELEMERQLKLKRDQAKRKNEFRDKISDLVEDEASKDSLLDGFDNKMKSLDNLLQSEMSKQQDALKAKLEARKNKKKMAIDEVHEATKGKEAILAKLESEREQLCEDKEDVLENGMKDKGLREKMDQERMQARADMDRAMQEKQEIIRKDYLSKLANAKNDKEKERLVDEMQRRLRQIEEDMKREREDQERNLEKILLARQQKRVKKLAHEQQKKVEQKDQEIKSLKEEIERDKARIMVDFGGDIPDLLDDQFRDQTKKLVDSSILAGVTALDLDSKDREQLDMLKVKQKIEKENVMNAAEKEIEDSAELEKVRMEEEAKHKIQVQKDEFSQRIGKAKSEQERKKLIAESKALEKRLEDQLMNERLHQDRVLEERRKQRMNMKKVKEIEVEQKHLEEQRKKEVDLLQKKYDHLIDKHHESFEVDVQKAVKSYERKGQVDKAVMLVNQATNDLLEKRLRLLINKQFFELEKYLGTLYNQLALERMAALQKSHARIRQAESEAYTSGLTGDALVTRLEQLKELQKIESVSIEEGFKTKEKERESQIREELEQKFCDERQHVRDDEQKNREALLNQLCAKASKGSDVHALTKQLIESTRKQTEEENERAIKEKEVNIEKIKLQLIAEDEAEVQQMQKSIEEQLGKEKEQMEARMKKKREEVLGDRQRQLEARIKEMSGQLSIDQKELIMKQYRKELEALDTALARERDRQLREMRQKMIRRKIEAERLKKEEEQDKRVQQLKKQIGKFLLTAILQARHKANITKTDKQVAPPMSSMQKKRIVGQQAHATSSVVGEKPKDLRLLLEQWRDKINQDHQNSDFANIWEKRSVEGGGKNSPKSSMVSKTSRITGFQGGALRGATLAQGGVNLGNQGNNYTIEDLMRRIKRIQYMTEKMSQGKFEGNNRSAKIHAEKVLASVQDGSLPSLMINGSVQDFSKMSQIQL